MRDEIKRDRDAIVQYLRRKLIGPAPEEEEELDEPAYKYYTAGTLYPPVKFSVAIEEEEEDPQGAAGSTGENTAIDDLGDDPVVLANQNLPSSMGVSFYLQNERRLDVEVTAAWYEEIIHPETGRKIYRRRPLKAGGQTAPFVIEPEEGKNLFNKTLFDDRARLHAIWRPSRSGWLVTVSLINNRRGEEGKIKGEDCLHQPVIRCRPVGDGVIPPYPGNRLLTDDIEEHLLDLLYRHSVTYGVGHGCSVEWKHSEKVGAAEVSSEFMPSWEVFPISYQLKDDFSKLLGQHYLAEGEQHPEDLFQELRRFVEAYRDWVENQPVENSDIPVDLEHARNVLMERMRHTASRMEKGVQLLEQDPTVLRAFCLANKAMLLQYLHSDKQYAGTRQKAEARTYIKPDPSKNKNRLWRPFQLAFQLLTIPSVAFPEDPDRELVDLIWFPTGGGKTEAYLAVTAFQIFYRRMMYGSNGAGTAVIMRYTLRLLTTQQFQRAATLICACEMIRREFPDELGKEQISIGLWVGGETTPNTFQEAADLFKEILEDENPLSPFQLDRCPWCGTEIVPRRRTSHLELYGIVATPLEFALFCPRSSCPFHEQLPAAVVDDQLYQDPPTLLLATVDKFARLAWVEKGGVFFGNGVRRPPELIIQDELHLISGPVGTIVGLYESAVDALASWKGVRPKIIASTATIRRAEEQCLGLYARPVSLFPPAGLDFSNSYFSGLDTSQPGRLYIGFMGQGHTGSTSMIRVSAALLQAPSDLNLSEAGRDAYWTVVAYHNSLRELGKTLTFARDDIPARIKVIAADQSKLRQLRDDSVQELTSNISGYRLSSMLERLNHRYDHPESISFLACSNMFSVGVDIPRLGLMLVNGQPKSTSEYIQSTSRVGRGVPGLVVCLLSPSKPRDRSHYERFVGYHSALYRHVEPTSVTPFAHPARDRALHAVLVTLVRHALGLSGNSDVRRLRRDYPGLERIVDYIVSRVQAIDPDEASETGRQLEDLIETWLTRLEESDNIVYDSGQTAKETLLINHGQKRKAGWPTLHSMRNVDRSSIINIIEHSD